MLWTESQAILFLLGRDFFPCPADREHTLLPRVYSGPTDTYKSFLVIIPFQLTSNLLYSVQLDFSQLSFTRFTFIPLCMISQVPLELLSYVHICIGPGNPTGIAFLDVLISLWQPKWSWCIVLKTRLDLEYYCSVCIFIWPFGAYSSAP